MFNPRLQPHVLVITGNEPEERDYTVEHPDCCPLVCYWTTTAIRQEAARMFGEDPSPDDEPDPGQRDCYVQYEVEGAGLESIDVSEPPAGVELDPPDYSSLPWRRDGDWRRLRPGRYLIEGWFTLFCWAGSEPIDADGGLTLLGPA